MGRKGVSKQKSSQNKSKPGPGAAASGSVSSIMQKSDNQPARSADKASTAPASSKKSPKKG